MKIKTLSVVLLVATGLSYAKGEPDTLRPATMTSDNLITLTDYTRDAPFGKAYTHFANPLALQNPSRKTIFNRRGSKFILPAVFMAYGTAARFNQLPVRQWDLDIEHEIRPRINRHYAIDDYLEVATPALAYGLGFIPGIEGVHNHRDRTLIVATSLLVVKGLVYTLKSTIPVARPRGWDDRSFPSGHTSAAMAGAHLMYKEYKEVSPWIGFSGYLMATVTGAFRMINSAHWFSDVVMGAGIGLLSVEIGYMMLPVWHSLFGIEGREYSFSAVPAFSNESVGLGMVCRF